MTMPADPAPENSVTEGDRMPVIERTRAPLLIVRFYVGARLTGVHAMYEFHVITGKRQRGHA